MAVLTILVQAVWFILPAMAPSSGAVLLGGGAPIDFGKKGKDGRRILGDGKTWRGLAGGTLTGMALGGIQNFAALEIFGAPEWAFSNCWSCALVILFLLSFGSMIGDISGSWLKRRMGIRKGAKMPVMDQYDLLIGALILVVPLHWDWFYGQYMQGDQIYGLIFIIVLIPLLHRATNIIGYKMGKKEVPW